MLNIAQGSPAFADTKKHYAILDGLRGVAALTVVLFHIFETFSLGDPTKQIINHGYLAVDFFFLLSGYVIGYAYDDRWGHMSIASFFKRRLIRLHPMIIIGMLIGAILFYFQDSFFFPKIHEVPLWKMLLTLLIGCTLIPVPVSWDIRGWAEMHPLNGPAWSLFFEYIANILYALVLRKLPHVVLAILTIIAGGALIWLSILGERGDVIGGWSLDPVQMRIGFTRLLYPFFAGLLLSRITIPGSIPRAFLWSSILLLTVLIFPRLGDATTNWMNGIYDAIMILFVFPIIIYIGASGQILHATTAKVAKFLGDISFPIYIIHYPFIYTFMAWVSKQGSPEVIGKGEHFIPTVIASIITFLVSIGVAYACVKLYDEPVRKKLMARFLPKKV